MKILINTDIASDHRQRIQYVSPDLEIVEPKDEAARLAEIPDTDIMFGDFNRSLFEAAERLKWVQVLGAGVDGLLFPEFVESEVVLVSAKGFVGPHLADQTWALILGLLRGVGRAMRERTWENRWSIRDETWELGGRTLGIVGLGGTGIDVAKRAQGFDMRVIAVDPEDIDAPLYVHEVWKMNRFHHLLAESDIVSICAPLTDESLGMFDDEAFRRMKPSALLINVTRGEIVDERSLLRALQENRIGGAGLDVTPQEPLPPDSPLWDLPNVIITPHVAGGSPHRLDRTVGLFCDNLERFLAGKPLLSVIDKRKGY